MKDHKQIEKDFYVRDGQNIEEFLDELKKEADGLVGAKIYSYTWAGDKLLIKGWRPLSEGEKAAAKRKRERDRERREEQKRKQSKKELDTLMRLAAKHGVTVKVEDE